MSARLASPRTVVLAACGVLILLGGLLGFRAIGGRDARVRTTNARAAGETAPGAAALPEPKRIVVDELTIPCWSCPEAADAKLQFRTDLDMFAPLGTGKENAAVWLAAFTQPDGPRAAEAEAILKRRVDRPGLGNVLPADDPFLAEAAPWTERATMRFHPDVRTTVSDKTPNLLLALTLGRSWVARGADAARFEDAMADFRRAVRLGRLLRQDDVEISNDIVGLAILRNGLEGIYERAKKEGKLDLALAAAIAAGEAPSQRWLSAARMTTIFSAAEASRQGVPLSRKRADEIRKIALSDGDRRFRLLACSALALPPAPSSSEQSAAALAALRTLAHDHDPFVAARAALVLADVSARVERAPATGRR